MCCIMIWTALHDMKWRHSVLQSATLDLTREGNNIKICATYKIIENMEIHLVLCWLVASGQKDQSQLLMLMRTQ